MSETVVVDVEMKSSIERVWHALTDPATISEWMLFATEDFRPEVGHTFRLRSTSGWDGVVDGEVLEAEAPRRLSYTWTTGGQDDQPHATVVTWTLSEGDDGATRVHLEQSGFRPEAKQEIGGAKAGWQYMLDRLQGVVAASSPAK